MKRTIAMFVTGIACIVGGGFFAKHVNLEAGSALMAVGSGLIMWLKQPPRFAQKDPGE